MPKAVCIELTELLDLMAVFESSTKDPFAVLRKLKLSDDAQDVICDRLQVYRERRAFGLIRELLTTAPEIVQHDRFIALNDEGTAFEVRRPYSRSGVGIVSLGANLQAECNCRIWRGQANVSNQPGLGCPDGDAVLVWLAQQKSLVTGGGRR